MALFDFLKRKQKKENHAIVKKKTVLSQKKVDSVSQERALFVKAPEKTMTPERALTAIIRPHVTERSREMSQHGVYVFRVAHEATKHMIAQAIEAFYRVGVERVRVMRIPSKPRRRGLTRGTKKGYKKAAVTLHAGEHIDLFS